MASVSGWVEGALFSILFLAVFGIVIAGMNLDYNKNYNLGVNDSATQQRFIEYQDTAQNQITGGDVAFDASNGISLKNSYGLAVDAISIIWEFLSGGFIENIINLLHLGAAGSALAVTLRILWFLSLVFALLYALFKVVF